MISFGTISFFAFRLIIFCLTSTLCLTKVSISRGAGWAVLLAVSPLAQNVISIIFRLGAAPQHTFTVHCSAFVVNDFFVGEWKYTDLIVYCVAR